jgi:lipoic acid synthetase
MFRRSENIYSIAHGVNDARFVMSSSTKPNWVRAKAPLGPTHARLRELMKQYSLHTVCEEAHCPNVGECWGTGTVTFMIMGDLCTRACRFCNVKSGKPNGVLDPDEPGNIARAVKGLALKYVVITSVDRDDLPDGGASHFANTITAVKTFAPDASIETLIPDFMGKLAQIQTVVQAGPDVIGHNLETTEPLTPKVRDPRASYHQSLRVLEHVKQLNRRVFTKSSLMVGLGEREEDVLQTFRDLRSVRTDFLTLGQYLRPSPRNLPVVEYVKPERFSYYQEAAEKLGFLYVASGPLVRSSFRAGEYFVRKMIKPIP